MTLVVSKATGQVTDWGVSNLVPELGQLGPVTSDS